MELGLESGYGLKSGSFSQTPWLRFLLFGEFAAGTRRGVPITPGLTLICRCPSPWTAEGHCDTVHTCCLAGPVSRTLGPMEYSVFHRLPLPKPADSGHHRFTCLIPCESLGLKENLSGRCVGLVLEPSPVQNVSARWSQIPSGLQTVLQTWPLRDTRQSRGQALGGSFAPVTWTRHSAVGSLGFPHLLE